MHADQETIAGTGHGTTDYSKIGKGVHQGYILSYAYLTSMQSTSREVPGRRNHKLWGEISPRLCGEISSTSDMQMYHSNGRKQRGTKEPLDEGESGE